MEDPNTKLTAVPVQLSLYSQEDEEMRTRFQSSKTDSNSSPRFSLGSDRHVGLQRLLQTVGRVLAEDQSGFLSGVSLQQLAKGASRFLQEARASRAEAYQRSRVASGDSSLLTDLQRADSLKAAKSQERKRKTQYRRQGGKRNG